MSNFVLLTGSVVDKTPKTLSSGSNLLTVNLAGTSVNLADTERSFTWYHDVKVWGKAAEILENTISAGDSVVVVGSLEQESWEGKDGKKRTKTLVKAARVEKIDASGLETQTDAKGQTRIVGAKNELCVLGNLTRDVEIKDVKSSRVLNATVAINESYKGSDDKWVNKTYFVDLTSWSSDVIDALQGLTKGTPLVVRGQLTTQSWEKDGVKNSKQVISVHEVFAANRDGATSSTSNPQQRATEAEFPPEEDLPF